MNHELCGETRSRFWGAGERFSVELNSKDDVNLFLAMTILEKLGPTVVDKL